jgi:hypothetical protein
MTAAEAAVVPYKNAAPEGTDASRSRSTAACSAYSGAAICYADANTAQQPAMPVFGFLSSRPAIDSALQVAAFRAALGEAGYVERQNVAIDGAGLSAKQTIFRRRKGRRSNWPTKDSLTSSCACGLRLEARSCSDQRTSANRSS